MSELVKLLREAAKERRSKNQPRCGDVFDGAADEVDRLTEKLRTTDRCWDDEREISRQRKARIESLEKMNGAMESVLSLIGKHLKVDLGDVAGLLEAIGSQSAEVREAFSDGFWMGMDAPAELPKDYVDKAFAERKQKPVSGSQDTAEKGQTE